MAFLSLLDERIRAKGSRDPLGFEPVWTSFGRRLVGNLTTVTSSWRNVAVALLGFYWCNDLCRDTPEKDKLKTLQAYFIRYEQLAAYLRCLDSDSPGEILGITRVRQNLRDESGRVTLGTTAKHLILSDQISYGLWGLYSSAMRATDLVRGDYRLPTDHGSSIAERMEARLDTSAFIAPIKGVRDELAHQELAKLQPEFLAAIEQPEVQSSLIDSLLSGSTDHALQKALSSATKQIELSGSTLGASGYVAALRQTNISPELDTRLSDIESLERLLVSSNILFDYCRRKDGKSLNALAANVDARIRFDFVPASPSLSGCRYRSDLEAIRSALRAGQTKEALVALFELNCHVMRDRGGAPWIELDDREQVRVRINSEVSELCSQKEFETKWHYSYFLESFARIAAEADSSS